MTDLSKVLGRRATLDDIPDAELDRLAASGFDWIWLLSVWQTGKAARQVSLANPEWRHEFEETLPDLTDDDIGGSGFAITAYKVHTALGGDAALVRLRERLRKRDMRLLLDFVPNHVAPDHPWLTRHPDYFVHATLQDLAFAPQNYCRMQTPDGPLVLAYGRDPYFPGWPDTLQLNYGNTATQDALIGELLRISRQCDGVRCDMAMLVLNDVFAQTWAERVDLLWRAPAAQFWPDAIRRAPMTYLAEVYWDREYELQQQGFDYTYDKRLLDRLHHGNPSEARGHLHADPAYGMRLARFLENHDEARCAPTFGRRLPAAAALTFTLPGLRFFFDGQFAGAELRAPVQLGRWPDDPDRPDLRDFYARLLSAINRPLFHDGTWSLLDVRGAGDPTFTDLIACAWRHGTDMAIVAANITDHAAQGLVSVGDLPPGDAFELRDQLSDRSWRWTRANLDSGLYVRLESGAAHVFRVQR